MGHKTRKLTTAAFAGAELLHRMPRPAMLLGTDRSVTVLNDLARQYLSDRGALLLARDRLTAFDKDTDEELVTVFQEIVEDIEMGGVPKRRIFRLGGPRSDYGTALSLTTFVPSESMYAFGTQPQVLMIVHEHSVQAVPDVLLWEAAFDLTPSQSRVALEIYLGHSIKEAAASLQIAPTTVKSHLKELFAKTGTRRQTQLLLALANFQAA